MEFIILFIDELWWLILDMSPWLLLGFLIAGVLHVAFPQGKINQLLGKSNIRSVLRAALIGIPLPLCSCGVIPTGISIYKNGASKGASVSFLISTPQTGVDSIMVTYSLLGLPFALVRPIVALVTGLLGGALVNRIDPGSDLNPSVSQNTNIITDKPQNSVREMFRYAFVEFMEDIAKWLAIGLIVAALIAVFVPDDFFANYIHNDFIGMLIILAASIPVYVCATSSVPIAAVLIMKGISPGAALVFLMAGPATNAATISVIGKSMGRKTLLSYLAALISGALIFGMFIDYLLPREWFTNAFSFLHDGHQHDLLPYWLKLGSGIVMLALLFNVFLRDFLTRIKWINTGNKKESVIMGEYKIYVRGMNCSHCKMNVETHLRKVKGIDDITADVSNEMVTIKGDGINFNEVKDVVEGIGYTYDGKVK